MTDPQVPAASTGSLPHGALSALAELARINLGSDDLSHVLLRVAELAQRVIPGVAEASVTLIVGGAAGSAAFTGPVATTLDERQYVADDGPCLDAARHRTTHLVEDTATDARWPLVILAAQESGVRSILSVAIPVQDVVAGCLNLYATRLGVFDEDAMSLAAAFANYAAVAIANAYLYSTTAALAEQLSEAMSSRAVIEQAKGILMAQQRISADDAFVLLSRASQTSNRKLRDIATGIVTGTGPART